MRFVQAIALARACWGGVFGQHCRDAVGAFLTLGVGTPLLCLGNPARSSNVIMFPKLSPFAREILRLLRREARGKLYTVKLIHDKHFHVFGRRIGKAPG